MSDPQLELCYLPNWSRQFMASKRGGYCNLKKEKKMITSAEQANAKHWHQLSSVTNSSTDPQFNSTNIGHLLRHTLLLMNYLGTVTRAGNLVPAHVRLGVILQLAGTEYYVSRVRCSRCMSRLILNEWLHYTVNAAVVGLHCGRSCCCSACTLFSCTCSWLLQETPVEAWRSL